MAMARSPASRAERIALIKLHLRAGTYEIDPETVAVAILLAAFGFNDTLDHRIARVRKHRR